MIRPTLTSLAAAAALLLGALTPTPAAAQQPAAQQPAAETPEEREARELYEKGVKLYDIADYDAAIENFKAAYKISSAPLLLYNIAQAYRLKGDCRQALQFYKNYLRNDPTGPQAAKAEKKIPEMEQCAATQPAGGALPDGGDDTTPGGDGTTPGGDVTPPLGGEIDSPELPPGDPVATPPIVDRGPRRPGRTLKLIGYATVGVGLATLGTGIFFAFKSRQASNEIADLYDMPGVVNWNTDYEATEAKGQKDEKWALWLSIGGGAAIIGGAAVWYFGWRADRKAESALTLVPTDGGAAAVWAGSF